MTLIAEQHPTTVHHLAGLKTMRAVRGMGRVKAKLINRVRGGTMGIASLHPSYGLSILRANRR
jgi:hypothetical protein